MVRTLFGKILLWSVVVQLVTVGTILALATYYLPESQEAVDNAFQLYADTAVTLYERFGSEAVDEFLAGSGENTLLYLKFSTSNPGGSDCGPRRDNETGILARGREGTYCLTVRAKHAGLPAAPDTRRSRLQIILILELLSCPALSYAVARYLSRPISELRRVSGRLAAGDLSARVAHRYARRHDEAAKLVREFNRMAERLAALIEAQRRLIGDVSHEIKSPLARLGVALELAGRDAEAHAPKQFARMRRELDNVSRLVNELLTLARINSATAEPPETPFDAEEMIADVIADIAFESPDRADDLVLVRSERPVRIAGDRSLLARAVGNVLRNAVFYTAPGARVTARCAEEGGRTRLVFTDQGPGVPEEALSRLFDPFYRVDDARTRRTGGTGIGLAICRGAVELHGGTVSARNVVPHGLEIVLDLPRLRDTAEGQRDSTQLHIPEA